MIGLVNVSGFVHAWHAQWYDGLISVITFVVTLIVAPHLESGIYIGVGLSLAVFLYKSMRPKISLLSRGEDQALKDSYVHELATCCHIQLIRFEGPLFFANASYLEDEINDRIQASSDLRHFIIACNGINDIDASGQGSAGSDYSAFEKRRIRRVVKRRLMMQFTRYLHVPICLKRSELITFTQPWKTRFQAFILRPIPTPRKMRAHYL